jgi:hypothetical protein
VEHLRRSLLLDFALEICVLASDDQRRISSREHTPERFLLLDATEPVSGSLLLNAGPFGMLVRGVLRVLMCMVCWCCGLPIRMWVGGLVKEAISRDGGSDVVFYVRATSGGSLGERPRDRRIDVRVTPFQAEEGRRGV